MKSIPEEIKKLGSIVAELEELSSLSKSERKILESSRLKIALWVCREEGLPPNPSILGSIIGGPQGKRLSSLSANRFSDRENVTKSAKLLQQNYPSWRVA